MDTENIGKRGVEIDKITADGLKSESALPAIFIPVHPCPSVSPVFVVAHTAGYTGRKNLAGSGLEVDFQP
jgi:hypothetical protein